MLHSTISLLDFGIVPTVWNCSYSMKLFLQYGIVPTVWNCSYSMKLFLQYGIVPTVWNCSYSMKLFLQYGIVPTVWNCSYNMELFIQYGIVPTVWNCSYNMELFLQYGIVPTIWNCSYSMELFLQYGIVPTIWNCSYSMELFLQYGIVNYLKDLRDFGLDKGGVDPFSPKYRLSSIICDVASFRLFKPVRSEPLHDNNRKFLHIPFANKGIDAINISNILNRKEVVKEIPPYFKNQSVPIVSYSYTNSIGRKIFNYKEALQDINIEEYLKNPLTCDCSHSPFQYNPSGHVITGDLNIIQHESLRKVISHGPKFREPQHINWKHNFKIIMDAVEDYARRWIKREVDQDPELESLSDWVRTIRSLVQGRIHKLKNCVNSRPKSVFKDQEAVKCLSSLHDKYVIVPADKASNNIVFVCKSYYFECLIKELGINSNTSSNITYKPTSFDKDEILANHRSFMTSLNIPSGKESEDLPYLYWIPKLHKTPYKERYIAGSSTCSTKELSIHLTKILSAVKEGQQKYCETVYSRSGINHMWILKNSKDLLDNLKSRSVSQVSSIKTFDFSTLYTTLPHDKLKTRLKETIHKAFSHRNYGSKFVVLGYNSTYFSNKFIKVKHATPRNK